MLASYLFLYPVSAYPSGATIDSLVIVDRAGNMPDRLRTGLEFAAVARVVNNSDSVREHVTVFEVRDSDGITIRLDFIEGILTPKQTTEVSSSFSTEVPGDYTLRTFVVDSFRNPTWMSSIALTAFSAESVDLAGVYVPLYKYPDLGNANGVWNMLIEVKKRHPSVPFVVTINPSSGPGAIQDARFYSAVSELKLAGVEYILGYVPTAYAREPPGRNMLELKNMIDKYRSWYPDVNGIMLDQVTSGKEGLAFYEELATYARSLGMTFIRGNAGTAADEEYLTIFDNIGVFEGRTLPDVSQLQISTHFSKYSPERFSMTLRNVTSLDVGYMDEALQYVGLVYITNVVESDEDRNPYNRLSQYFEDLVEQLQRRS